MKHLLELAVWMNYVPVITEHVTYNFLVNSIARLEKNFSRRMRLRNDQEREFDEIVFRGNGCIYFVRWFCMIEQNFNFPS